LGDNLIKILKILGKNTEQSAYQKEKDKILILFIIYSITHLTLHIPQFIIYLDLTKI